MTLSRDKRVTEIDIITSIIYNIFHRMFYCVQVLYTTNQETYLYSGISKDPLNR